MLSEFFMSSCRKVDDRGSLEKFRGIPVGKPDDFDKCFLSKYKCTSRKCFDPMCLIKLMSNKIWCFLLNLLLINPLWTGIQIHSDNLHSMISVFLNITIRSQNNIKVQIRLGNSLIKYVSIVKNAAKWCSKANLWFLHPLH